MKTSPPKTIDGVTYRRAHISAVQAGDRLYQMPSDQSAPIFVGQVESIERNEAAHRVERCKLTTGEGLTFRGWASRRLWTIAT